MKKFLILLAILSLFIASQAGAEYSWVLWLSTDEDQVTVWDIAGTELDVESCQQKLSNKFKMITGWADTTVLLSTDRKAIIEVKNTEDNTYVTVELICLPDTIDPREMK